MIGLAHRGFALNDYSQHIAQYLSSKGFETVLSGVQHEASYERIDELGYNIRLEKEEIPTPENGDKANANAVAQYLKTYDSKKPFFLSFGMFSTHRPYPAADESVNPNYTQPPSPMHDNADTRQDMADFITMAKCADDCVGTVLAAVKDANLENDTFIFFTTDHGIAFPKMKCNLYDTGIGVSLIVKYPGNPTAGQAIDSLVSHVDIFPTLCDIAGVERPDWLEGKSMLPLLQGETDKIRDEIFSEVTYHAAYEPKRCIRTERYKLIRYYDDYSSLVLPNMDDGLSKQFLLKHGLEEMDRTADEMLFDLYHDPMERENLIGNPKYKDIHDDLSKRLLNWMTETNDPLLDGYVPKPDGAFANRKDALHPGLEDME